MKKTGLAFLFFLYTGNCLHAQKKYSFSSQNYVGLITGEASTSLQLQTINGVKWNNWFSGIGTGIDWYYLRSIPVFASASRSFLQKGKRSLLASVDAGANFPWKGRYYNDFPPYDLKQYPGFYWSGSIGYKFGIGKADNAIIFQAGYSFKELEERVTVINCPIIGSCTQDVEKYNYRLRRFSFRIGWTF